MAIGSAQRFESHGLTWEITGTPYVRRTRIRLLRTGECAKFLDGGIRRRAARRAVLVLKRNAPVDTGKLRESIHNVDDAVIIGPKPYNRQKLKAQRAGRIYKQRKRGRVKLAKWYALPANVRSRQPEYVERSLAMVSKEIKDLCDGVVSAERDMFDLAAILAGEPIRRGAQRRF